MIIPYIVFGDVKADGVAQAGATISFVNNTKGGSGSETTDSNGHYEFDLSNLSNGYDVGDSITVQWGSNISATFIVDSGFELERDLYTFITSDSCIGADSISLQVYIDIPESGNGSESIPTAAGTTISDSGSGSESIQPTILFSISDSGVGSDVPTAAPPSSPSISDSGIGAETPFISVSFNISDLGSGSDSFSTVVAYTVSDSGSGSEQLNFNKEGLVTILDYGSATESIYISVSAAVNEIVSGLDTVVYSPVLFYTVSDSGSGSDSVLQLIINALQFHNLLLKHGTSVNLIKIEESINDGYVLETETAQAIIAIIQPTINQKIRLIETGYSNETFAAYTDITHTIQINDEIEYDTKRYTIVQIQQFGMIYKKLNLILKQ